LIDGQSDIVSKLNKDGKCRCQVESPFGGDQEDGRSGGTTIADRRLRSRILERWQMREIGWKSERDEEFFIFQTEKNIRQFSWRREGGRVEGLIEKFENVGKGYRKVVY